MIHLPDLIRDLAFILITAAGVSLIFKKLKQPVVLGYLIAGFFLGPNFPFFFNVKDPASISIWAELGVIFLLFGLGLEFSFRKLSRIGMSAGVTAVFETSMMFLLGHGLGLFFGWQTADALYLGGMVAISSTTIIIKAFEELALGGKDFVHFVFGVLVVEDLIAILFMVVLTAVGAGNALSLNTLFSSFFKLAFFLVIWFLVGIYAIPLVLKRIRSLMSDEIVIIVSLGLCLFMVVVATNAGFSASLGAFVMGAILAETKEGKKIEHLILPIKNLFLAIFFVSVGMMININALIKYSTEILVITLLVIFGKTLSVTVGALLSGQKIKNSLHSSFSLAQIGEFSFIIATLGFSLKATSDFLHPIAVAVSAITTFTTPYWIKASFLFYKKVEQSTPGNLGNALERYRMAINSKGQEGALTLLWRAYGVRIVLNIALVVGITLFFKNIVSPHLFTYFTNSHVLHLVSGGSALVLAAPFLWAIFFGSPDHKIIQEVADAIKLGNLLFGLTILRVMIGVGLSVFFIGQFATTKHALIMTLVFLIVATLFLKKIFEAFYTDIEQRFMNNLNQKDREEIEKKNKSKTDLAPWDAVLSEFVVSPASSLTGKLLSESMLKEKFNVTIALIERGERKIIAPHKETMLMPYDRLHLIGTEGQLLEAKKLIEESVLDSVLNETEIYYKLDSLLLSESSIYANRPIRECGLREDIDGLIVGIERDGQRILSPDSQFVLRAFDVLWVVGDVRKMRNKEKDEDKN